MIQTNNKLLFSRFFPSFSLIWYSYKTPLHFTFYKGSPSYSLRYKSVLVRNIYELNISTFINKYFNKGTWTHLLNHIENIFSEHILVYKKRKLKFAENNLILKLLKLY